MPVRTWLRRPTPAVMVLEGAAAAGIAAIVAIVLGFDDILGLRASERFAAAVGAGALLGWLGLAPAVRVVAWLGCLLAFLVATLPAIGKVGLRFVRVDSLPGGPVDAVVVLSATVSADGRLNPAGVDRLLEGARLTQAGVSRQLVVSRVWSSADRDQISSDRDQMALIRPIDPTVAVTVLDSVGSTRIEAERLAEVSRATGWRRVVVVTSPIHSSRACATVARVGFEVVCRPSPDRTAAILSQRTATDRLNAFGQWVYEWLGWRKYRAMGWV